MGSLCSVMPDSPISNVGYIALRVQNSVVVWPSMQRLCWTLDPASASQSASDMIKDACSRRRSPSPSVTARCGSCAGSFTALVQHSLDLCVLSRGGLDCGIATINVMRGEGDASFDGEITPLAPLVSCHD
jgi:hypothetical protein